MHEATLDEILEERVSSSRNRRNKRGVRRKMSGYGVRHASDKPLPTIDMSTVIKILLPDPSKYKRAPRKNKQSNSKQSVEILK